MHRMLAGNEQQANHAPFSSESELASDSESSPPSRRRSLRLSKKDFEKRKLEGMGQALQRKKARADKRSASPASSPLLVNVPETPPLSSTPDRPLAAQPNRGRQAVATESRTSSLAIGSLVGKFAEGRSKGAAELGASQDLAEFPFGSDYGHGEAVLRSSIDTSRSEAKALLDHLDRADEAYQDMSAEAEHQIERLRLQCQQMGQAMRHMEEAKRILEAKKAGMDRSLDEMREREKELIALVSQKEQESSLLQRQVFEGRRELESKMRELESVEKSYQADLHTIADDYDELLIKYESDMDKLANLLAERMIHSQKMDSERKQERKAWRQEKAELLADARKRCSDLELVFQEALNTAKAEAHELIQGLHEQLSRQYDDAAASMQSVYEDYLVAAEQALKTLMKESVQNVPSPWVALETALCQNFDVLRESCLFDMAEFQHEWQRCVFSVIDQICAASQRDEI